METGWCSMGWEADGVSYPLSSHIEYCHIGQMSFWPKPFVRSIASVQRLDI